MRAIIGIIVAAAIAFCGWWFVGAQLFRGGVENWFAAQTAEGRTAAVEDLDVGGFPLSFDVTAGAVAIFDPASGWGWQTPSAAVTMPAWWPLHVDVALPQRQVLETPAGQVELWTETAQGRFRLSPSLAPVSTEAFTGALTATTASGEMTAGDVRFRSERTAPVVHRLNLEADGLGLTSGNVDLEGGTLRAEAEVTLAERVEDLPDAVAVPVERVVLQGAELRFADAALRVSGEISADAEGYAAGELVLHVENWQAILRPAAEAGLIPGNRIDMLEGALRMMGGSDGSIDLPLTLSGGEVRFGPLALAPAPRLR